MTAPKASPSPSQGGLFDGDQVDAMRRAGRVELAVAKAVSVAKLDDVDLGGAALAVELARAVDVASVRSDPYGVAAAGRELREQLARLRLDPVSRDGLGTGGVEAFLRDLAEPS